MGPIMWSGWILPSLVLIGLKSSFPIFYCPGGFECLTFAAFPQGAAMTLFLRLMYCCILLTQMDFGMRLLIWLNTVRQEAG